MAAALIAALFLGAAHAQPPWPTPLPWPVQHTHKEIQFTPKSSNFAEKKVNYDFPNRALRYDIKYLSGPLEPFVTLMNFTSLWLNDTLYMIQWEAYLDKTPNCVALSMGFGLMKPNWFAGGQQYGIFWPAKKTDGADPAYHSTLVTVTDAGQGVDLPFSYYSLSENNTDTDGTPFLMHAPSPSGMVVNEYYDFVPAVYAPHDPIFALPASPKCVPVGTARSAKEAHALLSAASPALATLHLTEVFAAGLGAV